MFNKNKIMYGFLFFFTLVALFVSCSKTSSTNSTVNATQNIVVPLAPSNLTTSINSNSTITLNWTDNSTNETGFKIERKSSSTNYNLLGTVTKDVTNFLDSSVVFSTLYTYRIYSYNQTGSSLSYTNEASITAIGLPVISTKAISDTGASNLITGGNVTNDGGSLIMQRGVVYSTTSYPTIINANKIIDSTNSITFTTKITGLDANTKYFIRSFATNSLGTSYGNQIEVVTKYIDLSSGLVAYYTFNGNSKDSTLNHNDQIEYSNPTYVEDRKLNKNSAIYFNGNNYTLSNNSFLNSSNDYSISIWFKSNSSQPGALFNTIPHQKLGVNLNYLSGKPNKLVYFLGNGISTNGPWSIATDQFIDFTIISQKWYNLVINFSSNLTNSSKPNTWDFYIDGKLYNTFTSSKSAGIELSQFGFGAFFATRNYYSFYTGALDDVRVYDKILSISQIEYISSH